MSSEAIRIHAEHFPVVVVEPLRVPTEAELSEFLQALEQQVTEHAAPFAIVLDARGGVRLSRAQEKAVAAAFERGALAVHMRGEVVLFGSWLIALFARWALFVIRPPLAMTAMSRFEPALEWARQRASSPKAQ